ncbi:hypothetical protein B0O99DRAFT_680511 [Bisporella sp. PMI_857]|nr:hypothetical protein B0O99DRAFT_680511 [Bisporella sp. PMI_857]
MEAVLVVGATDNSGWAGAIAVAQGGLLSMADAACRELENTNIQFNEVYLGFRVDHDAIAEKAEGRSMGSSTFAAHYERILSP